MTNRTGSVARILPILLLAGASGACQPEEPLALPTAEEAESYFTYRGELEASLSGNVVEVRAVQSADQLARGGSLWARVGPYILLFSDATRQLFLDHPGIAAVRVVTRSSHGDEVARALLRRDELSDLTWRRALHISGVARRDGTERPSRLQELVRWGEEHTDYRYSSDYVRGR